MSVARCRVAALLTNVAKGATPALIQNGRHAHACSARALHTGLATSAHQHATPNCAVALHSHSRRWLSSKPKREEAAARENVKTRSVLYDSEEDSDSDDVDERDVDEDEDDLVAAVPEEAGEISKQELDGDASEEEEFESEEDEDEDEEELKLAVSPNNDYVVIHYRSVFMFVSLPLLCREKTVHCRFVSRV